MTTASSVVRERVRFLVRRDLRVIRRTLRRIQPSEHLLDLCLLGNRMPPRMVNPLERRAHRLAPMEIPVHLTRATFDGEYAQYLDDGECGIPAVTRDVTLGGIGFAHEQPLEADYAIVTLSRLVGQTISFLLEIRWSKLERGHTHISGGRIVGAAEPLEG